MRKTVSAVVAFIALTGLGTQAQEAPLSPPAPTAGSGETGIHVSNQGKLSISPATVSPNGRVTLSGSGCTGATAVSVVSGSSEILDARRIASMPTRGDGSFRGAIQLPDKIGLGLHTISAVCGDELIASVKVRVVILGFLELDGVPGTLTISRSIVPAGKRLRILAQSCESGTTSAALDDTSLKLAARSMVDGAFKAEVTIPKTTRPGVHTLSTRCAGLPAGAVSLRVVSAAGGRPLPASAGGLPLRPISLLLGVIALLALILVVSIILSFQRHRTRISTPGYFDLPSTQRQVR